MTDSLCHAIILASIRQGRFGDIPADWLLAIAGGRAADYEIVDLRDVNLPLFDDRVLPSSGPSSSPEGRRWRARMNAFDGYVFVMPEYDHGVPGALKNALDYCNPEFNRKPATFLAYGGNGGARSVEQLRLVTIALQMAPLSRAVHIGMPDFAALAAGEKTLAQLDYLNRAASAMLDELEWWSAALARARAASG